MTAKKVVLLSEAMGTRAFKYAAGVAREADGTFTLNISSVGPKGSHCLPPAPVFTSDDLDGLAPKSKAFLDAWGQAQPQRSDHVLCRHQRRQSRH